MSTPWKFTRNFLDNAVIDFVTILLSLRQLCQVPDPSYFRNYLWWQVILSYVKWGMASFRCYGNSDLDEMYPIWNFHLPQAQHLSLIFCWTDNGAVLVAFERYRYSNIRSSHLNSVKIVKLHFLWKYHHNRRVHAWRGIMGNQGKISRKQGSKMYVFLHFSVLSFIFEKKLLL